MVKWNKLILKKMFDSYTKDNPNDRHTYYYDQFHFERNIKRIDPIYHKPKPKI